MYSKPLYSIVMLELFLNYDIFVKMSSVGFNAITCLDNVFLMYKLRIQILNEKNCKTDSEAEVSDALVVHVLQAPQDLPDVASYLRLCDKRLLRQVVQQFTTGRTVLRSGKYTVH